MTSAPAREVAREEVVSALSAGAGLSADYVALILASCAIATFGLLENSPAVIIGAMIVAPLMPVIQGFAFGALDGAADIFRRGALALVTGIVAAVVLSGAIARLVGLSLFGSEILSRTRPTLLDLGVAVAAGAVGGYARIRPSIASTVAGTAIAVALMPPLCVVGIGLAGGDWEVSRGALLLFVTNLLGIALTSMIVFSIAGYARLRSAAALVSAGVLTAAILVPLTWSLRDLVREAGVESALRRALTTQTATFRQATLVSTQFDWLTQPPTATLLVRSNQMVTPTQVALLEAFALRATGQRFRLVIDVSQIERITARGSETGPR